MRFPLIAVLLFVMAGCRATEIYPVQVNLYPDGHLDTGKITVSKDEIPAFAKDYRDGAITICPVSTGDQKPSYTKVAEVRDLFKAAGVKYVTIESDGR